MSKVAYNKLVRDNIPKIIIDCGKTPYTRILKEDEYLIELRKKLQEELEEFLRSDNDINELADIIEVIEAVVKANGSSLSEVMDIKSRKQEKNGAFDKRIFLESVEE